MTTGPTRGDQVAILKGIEPGTQVITSGQVKLKNGTPLIIWDQTVDPTPPSDANVFIAPYDPPAYVKLRTWDGQRYGFRLVRSISSPA